MKLIEAFNKTETLRRLNDIKTCLTGRTTISFHEIYDRLGRESEAHTDYHHGNGELINHFIFPIMYPQDAEGMDKLVDNIQAIYRSSFEKGTYFHFKSDRTADERMIINLTTQSQATELVQCLLFSASQYISRIKFYASKQESLDKFLKCDKVVIYYTRQYRAEIYKCVSDVAKAQQCVFKNELSAFYHIVGDDNGEYHVGIGMEQMGTSFTDNRTAEILKELTGVALVQKEDKDKQFSLLNPTSYNEAFFGALYQKIVSHLRGYQ